MRPLLLVPRSHLEGARVSQSQPHNVEGEHLCWSTNGLVPVHRERRTEIGSESLETLQLFDSDFMSAKSNNNNKKRSCTSLCYFYFILPEICMYVILQRHQFAKVGNYKENKRDKLSVLPHRSFGNYFTQLLHCPGSPIGGASYHHGVSSYVQTETVIRRTPWVIGILVCVFLVLELRQVTVPAWGSFSSSVK